MEFSIETDDVTLAILETTAFCLQKYLGYSEAQAVALIEQYYHHKSFVDEDFIHHEGPFRIAVRMHYFVTLQGNPGEFENWKRENNLMSPPQGAPSYFLREEDQL